MHYQNPLYDTTILGPTMNPFITINNFIQKHNLISPNQIIIVGLSGGPDSVFLLHYLHAHKDELNLTIIAAHLDHQWRASSAQDAALCQDLCNKLDITLESKKISDLNYISKATGSKEQDARNARRFFFGQVLEQYNAHAIALAHHQDDQQETFFIRLLRGATVTGLACMWPKHGPYIRPLLAISKQEILDWLKQHNIAYALDPTNQSNDYLRNHIRNELVPLIKKIDTRFTLNMQKTIGHLQQTEVFLEQLTIQTFAALAHYDNIKQCYVIDKAALLAQSQFMQHRLIMHWLITEHVTLPASTSFLDEIMRFLNQPGSKEHAIHHAWRIVKQKNICWIVSTHSK